MPMFFFCMSGKPFHFRGCGWSRKREVSWSKDDMAWIFTMNDLFNKMFGKDALSYEFDKGLKRVVISPDCLPIYQYDHALWEQLFPTVLTSFTSFLEQPQTPQAIPASSPASSNTDPVSSSSTSLSSSPPLALQIPVAALCPVSQWILNCLCSSTIRTFVYS